MTESHMTDRKDKKEVSRAIFSSCKMALNQILCFISIALAIIGTNASGELTILHSPKSLKFSGHNGLRESLLQDVFSAALGMTISEDSKWTGLHIKDPFSLPEAVVEVHVDGIPNFGKEDAKYKNYPLVVDVFEPDTFDLVKHRIDLRNTASSKLVTVKLSDYNQLSELFSGMGIPKVAKETRKYLKATVEEDIQFLQELANLDAVINEINNGAISSDNVPDLFYFRFTSLHYLSDFHGSSSPATKEAKKLLFESLARLSAAFVKAYDGSVLVAAVATDVTHTRRVTRQVHEKQAGAALLAAENYSADYPVIFNIILWFMVVLVFTLVSIIYALADMDPGRDSIIYRMTSTRMKKDN